MKEGGRKAPFLFASTCAKTNYRLKGTKPMGYTHYFPHMRDFTKEEWAEIQSAARKILAATTVPLAFEYNQPDRKPLVGVDYIRFNGVEEKGHETFTVHRSLKKLADRWEYYANQLKERGYVFVFCKTAYKPYDIPVTAILSAINVIAPGALDIDSDGEPTEWRAGVMLAQRALGKDIPNPIEILRARQRAAEEAPDLDSMGNPLDGGPRA